MKCYGFNHDLRCIAAVTTLQKNTVLKLLSLAHNRFGDLSGEAFKEALTNNDTLHELNLSWNVFRSSAAVLISDGIQVSPTPTTA